MEEWKEYKLEEIAIAVKDRIDTSILDRNSYISTENMLPNRSGVTLSAGVPMGNAIHFRKEDVLISNIRPYFKKIWRAGYDGGCSTDVVCLRATEKVDPLYLYYLLSQDLFFDFIMQGAKGTKMPRGDKKQMMQWPVLLPSFKTQQQISSILKTLDDKIQLNKRVNDNFTLSFLFLTCFILWLLKLRNDNLQQQASALYKSWFVDFDPFKDDQFEDSELGLIPRGWSVKQLGEITTQINERVKERVDVKVLSPITTGELVLSEEYFTKQVYSESISKYMVVRPSDFAYNPARVNIGSLGMNEYVFDGCVSPVYVVFRCEDEYQHFFDLFRRTQRFQDEVNARSIGGVRQTMSYKEFSQIKLIYPSIEVVRAFNEVYLSFKKIISAKHEENVQLASLRDLLLPKIMSRSTIL